MIKNVGSGSSGSAIASSHCPRTPRGLRRGRTAPYLVAGENFRVGRLRSWVLDRDAGGSASAAGGGSRGGTGPGVRAATPGSAALDSPARRAGGSPDRRSRAASVSPASCEGPRPSVAGIVAEPGAIPPGASYRVHAEWRSLEPLSSLVDLTGGRTPRCGAGASRRRVRRPRRDRRGRGRPRCSSTAAPTCTTRGPTRARCRSRASSAGRRFPAGPSSSSPRPVPIRRSPSGLASWSTGSCGATSKRASRCPTVATGLHLTRPCRPEQASIRALDPDVVVALDTDAAAQVDAWCEGNRSTTVIELIDDPSITLELVSWQIGHASGRVRARIGRRVDAPALAATVRRLCAGPQPLLRPT